MDSRHSTALTPERPAFKPFHYPHGPLAYDDIPGLRQGLAAYLHTLDLSVEVSGGLCLAVSEVLSNLVKHPLEKPTRLELRAQVRDQVLEIEILDDSTPFDLFDEKMHASATHAGLAVFSEGGYGLGLVRRAAHRVCYTPAMTHPEKTNCFAMIFDLRQKGQLTPSPAHLPVAFLIDDDAVSLSIHGRMLKSGYRVETFTSARAALEAFSARKPDVIISDIIMPDMNGLALRRALSLIPGGDSTPFVFLSGLSTGEKSAYVSRLGIDDFLPKPVTQEKLLSVLTRLLRRARQGRESVQGVFHRDVTEFLKPTLPHASGPWRFCLRHAAAEAGGGDCVLWKGNKDGLSGIIADVMGHGVQAKFFSCAYAGYLRSLFRALPPDTGPDDFLRALSAHVLHDPLLEEATLTCQAFRFGHDGLFEVASAGHPPPVLRHGGIFSFSNVAGPLPGLSQDPLYTTLSLRLSSGDRAFFATDGFIAAFGGQRNDAGTLLESLARLPDRLPIEQAADEMWRRFDEYRTAGAPAPDDATFFIAEYGEQS